MHGRILYIEGNHYESFIFKCFTTPLSSSPTQGAGASSALQIVTNAGGYELVGSIMVDGAAALSTVPEKAIEEAKKIALLIIS